MFTTPNSTVVRRFQQTIPPYRADSPLAYDMAINWALGEERPLTLAEVVAEYERLEAFVLKN